MNINHKDIDMKDKIIEILNKNLSIVDESFGLGRGLHIVGIEDAAEAILKKAWRYIYT